MEKHFEGFHDHVLDRKKSTGNLAKVYDIVADLRDRRGLGDSFDSIDVDVQDAKTSVIMTFITQT